MKNTMDFLKRFGFAVFTIMVSIAMIAKGQEAEIRKSTRLLDIDQPAKAIEEINNAIKAYPAAAQLYYYLGQAQIKTGKVDLATLSFEKGIALNANEMINYAGLGHILLLNKKPAEA